MKREQKKEQRVIKRKERRGGQMKRMFMRRKHETGMEGGEERAEPMICSWLCYSWGGTGFIVKG